MKGARGRPVRDTGVHRESPVLSEDVVALVFAIGDNFICPESRVFDALLT